MAINIPYFSNLGAMAGSTGSTIDVVPLTFPSKLAFFLSARVATESEFTKTTFKRSQLCI